MSEKKEVIKKEVSLIRMIDCKLQIDYFDECYTYRGNHSVTVDGYNYYCKTNTFYCRGDYALVVNQVFKDDAIKMLFKSQFDHKTANIERLKISVEMAELKLNNIKEEMIKYLKIEQ